MKAGSWVHRGPTVETRVNHGRIHTGLPSDDDDGGVDDVGDDAGDGADADADSVGGCDHVGHQAALGAGVRVAEFGKVRRPSGLPVLVAVQWGDWPVPAIVPRERSAAPELWRWRWHGEGFPTHNHLQSRG